MAESEKKESICKLCERLGLVPFTTRNVLFYYVPMQSMVAYGGLSINILCPSLVSSIFPKRDAASLLLGSTLLGTSLYLYNRPHLKTLDAKSKATYSVVGATLFSFGSVLVWAVIRSAIPRNNFLAATVGFLSGYAIVRIGYSYLNHVDAICEDSKKSSA